MKTIDCSPTAHSVRAKVLRGATQTGILLAICWSVLAAVVPLAHASPDETKLLATLKSRYAGTEFSSVTRSAVPGLYEVVMGGNVAFVSAQNPRYLVFGRMLDTVTMQDLTAPRLAALQAKRTLPGATTRSSAGAPSGSDGLGHAGADSEVAVAEAPVKVSALPLADAIKTVRGNGSRQLVVFSDPLCGYCRRLQGELAQISDITIYTFVVPFQGREVPHAIWCASDQAAERDTAWQGYMTQGVMPGDLAARPLPACADPLDRNLALAERLHVQGTPTLIFADGSRIAAAIPRAQIESRLTAAAAMASTAARRDTAQESRP